MTYVPTEADSPFHRLGGEVGVQAIAARFYDHMDADEPELARLHALDANGKVSAGSRARFGLFLVEWTGGPPVYSPVHGHPRLRMRHGDVPVDGAMIAAWLRCMGKAMAEAGVDAEVHAFLMGRFGQICENLRNIRG